MKKLLLIPSLIFSVGISTAQTAYFQDDFSSGLNDWVLYDEDGDGNNWAVNDYNDGQGQVATSASWQNSVVLYPDNWMVSPLIDLTSASGQDVVLEWVVKAQDQDFADENYSVYINTSDDINTMEADGALFNEVIGTTSDNYVSRSVDVSSLAGNQVYIAFRHHNVSDQFRINIDDVIVRTPLQNDLAITSISSDNLLAGDREFTIQVTNLGLDPQTGFDLEWDFGSDNGTENITANLTTGQSYTITVNINAISPGQNQVFSAEITNSDDDNSNNSLSESFNFVVPVPQYTGTDSKGNAFDLYARLQSGQAILLDYMASWCGPCESSTPEISEWVQNNGSGDGRVEALAITVEQNDNNAVLNNLNWNGGYYEYPKFAYTQTNVQQFSHYASNHGLNSGGGIPFFILICPNIQDPGYSEISLANVGWANGMMLNNYEAELNKCPTATLDVIEVNEAETVGVKLFPNPSSTVTNVEFTNNYASNTTITVVNAVGQQVYFEDLGVVEGTYTAELNVASFESGIYFVNIKTENSVITKRLSVNK